MWYLMCLFVIIAFLSVCSIVGLAISGLVPARVRPYAMLGFSPLFGMAFFVLLATLTGWAGEGFSTWFCLPATLAAAAMGAYQVKSSDKILRYVALVSVVGTVASIGFLFSIIRFDAYNPFNDTFTYLVHAQWLQQHSFREAPTVSGSQPLWSQVLLYQNLHARMGASFLFGWVQALFGLEWSYMVYPSVVLLPLAGGALALSGACAFAVRRSRMISLVAGTAAATTVNGFSFGTVAGFLPQTYGLAFAFGGLTLLAIIIFGTPGTSRTRVRVLIPIALLFAALVYSYPEIVPFVAIAAALFLLLAARLRPELGPRVMHTCIATAAIVSLMVNFEAYRLVRSLLVQMSAVVGGPVPWTPAQFLSHSLGLLSGAWDGSVFVLKSGAITENVTLAFAVFAAAAVRARRHQIQMAPVWAALCMVVVAAGAFVYFRYISISPWTVGVGESWSQFKLSNWLSPFIIFLASCGLVSVAKPHHWSRSAVIGFLVAWQAVGLIANYRLANGRTIGIRQETGYDHAPFDAYRDLRQLLVRRANQEPVFLDLAGPHHKNRQMICYFLWDQKLASQWSDDGYIFPSLSPDQRNVPVQPGMLVLGPAQPTALPGERRVGSMALSRAGDRPVILLQISGGYNEETAGHSVWRWTPDQLCYRFKLLRQQPAWLRAGFTYLGATAGRQVRISLVQGGKDIPLETLALAPGWNEYLSPEFEVTEPEFRITFQCNEPPIRLGKSDPRLMSFLVRDLELKTARGVDSSARIKTAASLGLPVNLLESGRTEAKSLAPAAPPRTR